MANGQPTPARLMTEAFEQSDVSAGVPSVIDDLTGWAETRGHTVRSHVIVLGYGISAPPHHVAEALPDAGWKPIRVFQAGDPWFIIAVHRSGWHSLLLVHHPTPTGSAVLGEVYQQPNLGLFYERLGESVNRHWVEPTARGLIACCPVVEADKPEQMLAALMGEVFIPASAYA